MPPAPKTDAEAALMALGEARTWGEGLRKFHDLAPAGEPPFVPWGWADAERDFAAAIASAGWALLVAPEIHRIVQLHLSIRRVALDLKSIRRTATRLEREIAHPDVWRIVEVAKEGGPERIGPDGQQVDIVTRGPDVLSVRGTAATKARAEAIRGEEALAKLGERLDRAIARYQATLIRWSELSEQQQRAEVLRMAARDGALPTALALIEVAPDGPVKDGGSDSIRARLAKRLGLC